MEALDLQIFKLQQQTQKELGLEKFSMEVVEQEAEVEEMVREAELWKVEVAILLKETASTFRIIKKILPSVIWCVDSCNKLKMPKQMNKII